MTRQDLLTLAALLHDIGKFRQRAIERYKKHQEHSYEFVTQDFADYFAPCADDFKDAIRNHHQTPNALQHLIEKQVVLADRLSANEREEEIREQEDFVETSLVSILSRLEGADTDKEYRYKLTKLKFDSDSILPTDNAEVDQDEYKALWAEFKVDFGYITIDKQYGPDQFSTIVALLHKYTSRIPSATPWETGDERTISDISLYDHLRTTAAIAACIGQELDSIDQIDPILNNITESEHTLCTLIKGDISGIQKFLYHILSDGAARRLRGRSFYLQLLTEVIAHWIIKQLDLPITNLLLTSGGQFYILAPHTKTKEQFEDIRRNITEKLWLLHQSDIYCILDYTDVKVSDFTTQNFANKWTEVSNNIQKRKQKKFSEMGHVDMFNSIFEPQDDKVAWDFRELGKDLRNTQFLIAYEVNERSNIPAEPDWRTTMQFFGLDFNLCHTLDRPEKPDAAKNSVVYRIGDTDFIDDNIRQTFQWDDISTSYDFRIFHPVTAQTDDDRTADFDYIANQSEGVKWLGAMRMDVDNLGTVFTEKLTNPTISRLATLSESMRLFFEGYVPELCKQSNRNDGQGYELIYAGGDDLFLIGGWSGLPEIAERIRTEFRHFVTGDHITLSGGIAIANQKFPLYQFADMSEGFEDAAKSIDDNKNGLTFLRQPMKWGDFEKVRDWHDQFMNALTGERPLPRDFLARVSHIYSEDELKGHRWAWNSLYYFSRLLERHKSHTQFVKTLQNELNKPNGPGDFKLKEYIQVITRWTALRLRN